MPNNQQIANTFNTIADIINTGLAIGDMLGLTGGNDHGVENTDKFIFVYTRDNNGGYKLLGKEDGITIYWKYQEDVTIHNTETVEADYIPEHKAFVYPRVVLNFNSGDNFKEFFEWIRITNNTINGSDRGYYASRNIFLIAPQNSDLRIQDLFFNHYSGGDGIKQNPTGDDRLFDFIDDYGNKYVELRQDVNNQSIGSMVGEQIGQDLSGQIDPIALAALDYQLQNGLITQQEYDQAIANLQANQTQSNFLVGSDPSTLQQAYLDYQLQNGLITQQEYDQAMADLQANQTQNTNTQVGNINIQPPANTHTQPANTHTQSSANTNNQQTGSNIQPVNNNNLLFIGSILDDKKSKYKQNQNNIALQTKQAGFPVWLKLLFGGIAVRYVYKMFFKKSKPTK